MLPSFIIYLVNLVMFSYDLQKLYHWYASCAVLETVHYHPQSQVEPSPLRQFGQMWVAWLQHPSGLMLPWSLNRRTSSVFMKSLLPYFPKILFTTSMIMLILNFYGGFKLWTKTCRRLPRWHLDLSSHSSSWRGTSSHHPSQASGKCMIFIFTNYQ